jgi:hypothetical protein
MKHAIISRPRAASATRLLPAMMAADKNMRADLVTLGGIAQGARIW